MTLTLKNSGYTPGPALFYEEKFLQLIEDHLDVLRQSEKTTSADVAAMLSTRYAHDFIGFLNYLQVPNETHPIVIRMNGLKSAEDFDSNFTTILLPHQDDVEQLRQAYLTSYA